MIFVENSVDQATETFNNIVYTYYQVDRTWYAAGSEPGHVDPQLFQRRTYFQHGYDVVTGYEEFMKMDRLLTLRKNIDHYRGEVEKVLSQYRALPPEAQALDPDREQYLMDIIAQIQAYINHPDPDGIVWPLFPL